MVFSGVVLGRSDRSRSVHRLPVTCGQGTLCLLQLVGGGVHDQFTGEFTSGVDRVGHITEFSSRCGEQRYRNGHGFSHIADRHWRVGFVTVLKYHILDRIKLNGS